MLSPLIGHRPGRSGEEAAGEVAWLAASIGSGPRRSRVVAVCLPCASCVLHRLRVLPVLVLRVVRVGFACHRTIMVPRVIAPRAPIVATRTRRTTRVASCTPDGVAPAVLAGARPVRTRATRGGDKQNLPRLAT